MCGSVPGWQLQEAAADPHAPDSRPTRPCHNSLGPGCMAGGLGDAHAGRASPERCKQQAWCCTGQQAAPDACQGGREKEGHDREAGAALDQGMVSASTPDTVCAMPAAKKTIALDYELCECLLSGGKGYGCRPLRRAGPLSQVFPPFSPASRNPALAATSTGWKQGGQPGGYYPSMHGQGVSAGEESWLPVPTYCVCAHVPAAGRPPVLLCSSPRAPSQASPGSAQASWLASRQECHYTATPACAHTSILLLLCPDTGAMRCDAMQCNAPRLPVMAAQPRSAS